MALTTFVAHDGWITNASAASNANTPLQMYQAWCLELGKDSTVLAPTMNLDDSYIAVPLGASLYADGPLNGSSIAFAGEGGFTFNKSATYGANVNFSPAGLPRFFIPTPTGDFNMITFHPDADNYSVDMRTQVADNVTLFYGSIGPSGGVSTPRVQFALRFNGADSFLLSLRNFTGGGDIPVTLWSCGAPTTVYTRTVLTTLLNAAPGITLITASAFVGTVTGTVKDASGAFAARKVFVFDRASGALSGSAMSDATSGAFNINVRAASVTGGTYFVVVLDDDAAPDLNALIYDRIAL